MTTEPAIRRPTPPWDEATMTIEELASRVGMTVRNVRAYNSAGLLSPPQLRGRLGLYGQEHLEQLQVVRSLREQGVSLERIKTLVREDGSAGQAVSWGRLHDLARLLAEHLPGDAPHERQEIAELERIWKAQFTPAMAELMQRAGLQRLLPDGTIEHLTPGVRPIALRMASWGMGLEQALEVQAALSRELRQAVRAYLRFAMHTAVVNAEEHASQTTQLVAEAPQLLLQAVQAMLPVLLQQETQRLCELPPSDAPVVADESR